MRMGPQMLGRLRGLPREFRQAQARKHLLSEGYDALFHSDDSGAYPPEFSDLWSLVKILRETQPTHVLEYGSGWSTYVIAETLARMNSGARLTVVELDRHWLDIARSRITGEAASIVSIPKPEAKILIYGSVAGVEVSGWYGRLSRSRLQRIGVATVAFPALYALTPDFIYLDGPGRKQVAGYFGSCREFGEMEIATIVSDPLFMKGPFTICVDGRQAQAAFLKANLPSGYDVQINWLRKTTVFRPR
jgi:hypothetical protein